MQPEVKEGTRCRESFDWSTDWMAELHKRKKQRKWNITFFWLDIIHNYPGEVCSIWDKFGFEVKDLKGDKSFPEKNQENMIPDLSLMKKLSSLLLLWELKINQRAWTCRVRDYVFFTPVYPAPSKMSEK